MKLKNVIKLFVVTGLVFPSFALGAGFEKNPDRFPSIGLTYSGSNQKGQYRIADIEQDINIENGSLILDVILPVTDSVTLNFGLGGVGSKVDAESTRLFYPSETKSNGGIFILGARYYFNN